MRTNLCDSMIMLRSGKLRVAKEEFYDAKKSIKIWNVNINEIAMLNWI